MKKVLLKIDGMTCSACSSGLEKYLNKQVAYWYDYLKKPQEYDSKKYYTELDKDRIVDEVFENRKFFSNTVFAVANDLVVGVTEDELESFGSGGGL